VTRLRLVDMEPKTDLRFCGFIWTEALGLVAFIYADNPDSWGIAERMVKAYNAAEADEEARRA
jgi:hypothetical protein